MSFRPDAQIRGRRGSAPSARLPAAVGLAAALGALFLLTACELGLPAGTEPHRETNFLDMGDQPKLKPQRGDLRGERPLGMLAPPPGAIAVSERPYPFDQAQGELAGASLKNPLTATPATLARGKWTFEHVCVTCHGPQAAGDGHVTKLFPKPPSLMTQKVRDWSDGRIFHLPRRGQGSMPSQASVVEAEEIWSVILYLRTLQAQLPVAPPPQTEAAAPPPGAPDTPGAPDAPEAPDTPGAPDAPGAPDTPSPPPPVPAAEGGESK